jgi:Zn-dependent peptidase ImmA (M78 family)
VLYPAARRIVVAADDVPARQRFTLAHEVGHWVCQCRTGRHPPVLCRTEDMSLDPATRSREREANIFAAELLMPEEAVRSIAAEEAAQALGVSELALAWRRYSFDLGPRPVR